VTVLVFHLLGTFHVLRNAFNCIHGGERAALEQLARQNDQENLDLVVHTSLTLRSKASSFDGVNQ
jgi:hypothetical protein